MYFKITQSSLHFSIIFISILNFSYTTYLSISSLIPCLSPFYCLSYSMHNIFPIYFFIVLSITVSEWDRKDTHRYSQVLVGYFWSTLEMF